MWKLFLLATLGLLVLAHNAEAGDACKDKESKCKDSFDFDMEKYKQYYEQYKAKGGKDFDQAKAQAAYKKFKESGGFDKYSKEDYIAFAKKLMGEYKKNKGSGKGGKGGKGLKCLVG
ncbi:uncharacterized protein LOC125231491 [Leguminivora glycinivorella]|uniref:uncharacterized protein LOC125231491 n=1 Tax=Leguminivora glycinivorella TaxID=1035111 RepID=UPI00200F7F96|nr:uncharacterized protein LOC125231491 [Leguminivora glycinivorella]